MRQSLEGEGAWLLSEISNFNVPVKRRSFPKEASFALRDALDHTLSLAVSLHKDSPLAMSAFTLFILFPRLLLRPLPNGCQGRVAEAVMRKRCDLLLAGHIQLLVRDSHEAQTDKISTFTNAASTDTPSFSKTARAAILAGAGQVGRACKVAFTYGLETHPEVAAKFLKKLTLQARHSHIASHTSTVKPAKILISSKALTDAFSGMPKQSAAHRDGRT